jgi:hypothetical protein
MTALPRSPSGGKSVMQLGQFGGETKISAI